MRVRHKSRSEVLVRAEDDNGYWAMVGRGEEFTTFTGQCTTLPRVSIPISNRRAKHFHESDGHEGYVKCRHSYSKMRNAMAWRTYCRVE